MSIAIDIILALLALFIIIQYTVRGFVRSALGGLKLVLSGVSAFVLTPLIFSGLDPTSTAIAYLLVFSASYVVVSLLVFLIDKFFELPILNVINKLLGAALGIVCAYVTLTLAAALLSVAFGVASEGLFGITADELYKTTYIYKFFRDNAIFSFLK